ncbi:TonB-dependent receptor [Adhaeribacter aquaticus]|uniref:TonB-dependent receptor n=1 Tax=Adhaeribacter aquaticus TaxID=299567 RepID=UPI00040CA788|nr:TonB-dependent receptor [Adhaeribacter aquaticus]
MKKLFSLWAVLLCPLLTFAQFTLTGRITDAGSQQPLTGATVLAGSVGTTTDNSGNFSFVNLPAGKVTVAISFVGYETSRQTISLKQDTNLNFALRLTSVQTEEVVISATRANEKTGTTFTNVSKEQIQERNFGQDLPYLLDQTPSVVVNSDAGAGVGYTGIRIRGSDITRINVTVNGVPINDPESHGTFFVNMPDLASSVQDVQIQRGVGTSTNGAGAFGASINIRTLTQNRQAYAEASNSFGSFNTWRHTLAFGTGLINNKFTFDGRLSKISSDGYMDRAFSNLKSYYFAAGYYGKNSSLRFITFSGQEKTYQAWNGVPQDLLKTNRTYNSFTYENQTDNYQQDHYQLHYNKGLGKRFDFGGVAFMVRGRGYYEEHKENQRLSNYNIPAVVVGATTINRSDLIRQKWLDNYFYGASYALNYNAANPKFTATLGGAWNQYNGDHFGEVIWARYASTSEIRHRYYDGNALKTDFNIFGKANYQLTTKLGLFGDLQYRTVNYEITGTDDDKRDITQQANFNFFNPKAGVTYALTDNHMLYASYAVGNREPVRSDFVDRKGADSPKAETLYNLEAGYRLNRNATTLFGQSGRYSIETNYFFMDYNNQLVLTGQLNNVGSPLRTNIKSSYRSGVELAGLINLNEFLEVSSNLTLSRNKIRNYNETLYVYDQDYNVEEVQVNAYNETNIAFSPNVVSAHKLEIQPIRGLKAAILYKTVSKQYLDNTSSEDRKINPYQVADFRMRYTIKPSFMREIEVALLVNNLFNRKYEANGYTYSERYAGDATRYDYNYYYPQATRNFLASLNLRF